MPKDQRLPVSRLLLLQCYDAAHTRTGGSYQPCALQQARPAPGPGLAWTRQIRIAAAVDLFRKLTGDLTASSESLAAEAEAISKRRDAVNNTPSQSMRRWFAEPPLAATNRGGHGFGASRLPGHGADGPTASPAAAAGAGPQASVATASAAPPSTPKSPGLERPTTPLQRDATGAWTRDQATPGPGSYHTSTSDMSKRVEPIQNFYCTVRTVIGENQKICKT